MPCPKGPPQGDGTDATEDAGGTGRDATDGTGPIPEDTTEGTDAADGKDTPDRDAADTALPMDATAARDGPERGGSLADEANTSLTETGQDMTDTPETEREEGDWDVDVTIPNGGG